jgi:hypothetical protein
MLFKRNEFITYLSFLKSMTLLLMSLALSLFVTQVMEAVAHSESKHAVNDAKLL